MFKALASFLPQLRVPLSKLLQVMVSYILRVLAKYAIVCMLKLASKSSNRENIMTETQEAAIAIAKLVKFILAASKDGLNFADVTAFIERYTADKEFRYVFVAGIAGAQKIPTEFKEIKLGEIIDLIMAVLPELKK